MLFDGATGKSLEEAAVKALSLAVEGATANDAVETISLDVEKVETGSKSDNEEEILEVVCQ